MSNNSVVGMLLAGGESRRMGTDKAALTVDGFPSLLHRQFQLLQQLPLSAIHISRHQRHRTAADLNEFVVTDNDEQHHFGPLAGIHSIACHCPDASAALVLAVDQPLLQLADIEPLLQQGSHHGLACYYDNQYLPMYLPLTDTVRSYLAEQLATPDGNRTLRGLLACAGEHRLLPTNTARLANTNTQQEWQAVTRSPSELPESSSES